jgi:hypothetical protein
MPRCEKGWGLDDRRRGPGHLEKAPAGYSISSFARKQIEMAQTPSVRAAA